MDNDNFPTIEHISDYSSFFRDEIVFFYFHSVRFQKYTDFNSFSKRYETLLSVIKKCIQNDIDNTLPYLTTIYKLIANTRDIRHGKGLHDIAYMMIWKLYKFFPSLAIYMIYRFVKTTDNQPYAYGSWRDIKYLCGFVYQHSRHKEKDSIIEICIQLINTQLKEDINTWKFSENAMNKQYISHVAKWIPRENKKFGWLFDLLAIDWGKTQYPYIIKSASSYDSQIKAHNKYKQLYRKNVAFLNKALDTIEINLCANRRPRIEPHTIPLCAYSKYTNVSFYDSDDNDKLLCSQQIINHLESKYSQHNVYDNNGKFNTSSTLPISHYIKQAISVIRDFKKSSHPQFHILNKQWEYLVNVTTHTQTEYMIPIIDISYSMRKYEDEPLYTAIGYAILISQLSSIQNRIMVIDNNPVWIQFQDDMLFVHKVKHVLDIISSVYSTRTSYINTFNLIGKTFTNDIKNIQFVIFSTFTEQQSPDTNLYDTIVSAIMPYTKSVPHISFWNLSKHDDTFLPCPPEQNKVKLLSGYSPHLISLLYNPKPSYTYTPYTNILYELNSYQYDIFNQYINQLVCM